jgi:hypothetical protein
MVIFYEALWDLIKSFGMPIPFIVIECFVYYNENWSLSRNTVTDVCSCKTKRFKCNNIKIKKIQLKTNLEESSWYPEDEIFFWGSIQLFNEQDKEILNHIVQFPKKDKKNNWYETLNTFTFPKEKEHEFNENCTARFFLHFIIKKTQRKIQISLKFIG